MSISFQGQFLNARFAAMSLFRHSRSLPFWPAEPAEFQLAPKPLFISHRTSMRYWQVVQPVARRRRKCRQHIISYAEIVGWYAVKKSLGLSTDIKDFEGLTNTCTWLHPYGFNSLLLSADQNFIACFVTNAKTGVAPILVDLIFRRIFSRLGIGTSSSSQLWQDLAWTHHFRPGDVAIISQAVRLLGLGSTLKPALSNRAATRRSLSRPNFTACWRR